VSAVGNALSLRSPLSGSALLRALNGASPQIFFTAATSVPDDFRVRRTLSREYRYFFTSGPARPDRFDEATRLLTGMVDVRSFGRALPQSEPVLREIEFVRYEPAEMGGVLIVRARSFVWGMVRKIVAALREVDSGRLPARRLARALAGEERLTLPMAEPEPLVLWNVEYGLPWQHRSGGPNRHQARWWAAARTKAETRSRVLDCLTRAAVDVGRPRD
jgi:tRNA pseudouridine38-40 synthase